MTNKVKIKNVRVKQELSHLKHIRKSKKELRRGDRHLSIICI